mmetsp:Transcript_15031/g.42190  ORF Transcript_15031/g.42190 Transcript_15031/m.42190 type:complete len:473 (+) Transcript_15031:140-1558(+)
MERGELQSKLQELKVLQDLELLTCEQVQRTTNELLKAFATPMSLLRTSMSGVHDQSDPTPHNTPMADQTAGPEISGNATHTPDSGLHTIGALAEAMSLPGLSEHHDRGASGPAMTGAVPTEAGSTRNINPATFHARHKQEDLSMSINEAASVLREPDPLPVERPEEPELRPVETYDPDDAGDFEEFDDCVEGRSRRDDTVEMLDGTDDGSEVGVRRNNWRFLTCMDSREDVEKYLAETGLQFSWHRGGGKKGGYTKLCKSHKNCEYTVRVSLVRSGWMVCCRGNHSEKQSDRYRGILPKYMEEIDRGCREKKMPRDILRALRTKYGAPTDLPTAKQIDNRKRTLMTREGIIPRRINPKKLKTLQQQSQSQPGTPDSQPAQLADSPNAHPAAVAPLGHLALGEPTPSSADLAPWDQILRHMKSAPSNPSLLGLAGTSSPHTLPSLALIPHHENVARTGSQPAAQTLCDLLFNS